jgi:DGQHR domain-containing protein
MFPKSIRFKFPKTKIDCYLTVVESQQLRQWREDGKLKIEYLSVAENKGRRTIKRYQRTKELRRIGKIRTFLTDQQPNSVIPPILPQNVVLNVREKFKPVRIQSMYRIPDNLRYHVIDGQHRIEALIEIETSIPLPVTILTGLTEIQEGALFLLINHTQKRVPASIRMLDIAGMRRSRQGRKWDLDPLLQVLGFSDADVDTLEVAADQALKREHFWFDKISLPSGEE